MNKFDLVFAGNGILTVISALKLKKQYPQIKIAIVGPSLRPYSASVAAGAMHAVFCEVEETFPHSSRDREIFDVALEARGKWLQLLNEFGLQDMISAESTIMYRRKNGTPFEQANFDIACQIAEDHKCIEDVDDKVLERIFCGKLKSSEVIAKKFVGEFALDTYDLFTRVQTLLEEKHITFFDTKVQSLERRPGSVQVRLATGATIEASRTIVAAGSYSASILPKELPMVRLYHAVGTSMVLDSAPSTYQNLRMVVRTPNRGGAQCGMHIVPRNGGKFYLGAGNYLSDKEPAHRVETIRYLIDICQDELYGKQTIYHAKAEPLLGSRPKSVDGYPIVGTWQEAPEIFVMTGMYRIGLTIAPVVAEEVCHWFEKGQSSNRFPGWQPSRKLHSYGSMEVATRYYSESRISNLVEHGLLDFNDKAAVAAKKVELEGIAKRLNAEIVKRHNFYPEFVADPDMYAILSNMESL